MVHESRNQDPGPDINGAYTQEDKGEEQNPISAQLPVLLEARPTQPRPGPSPCPTRSLDFFPPEKLIQAAPNSGAASSQHHHTKRFQPTSDATFLI